MLRGRLTGRCTKYFVVTRTLAEARTGSGRLSQLTGRIHQAGHSRAQTGDSLSVGMTRGASLKTQRTSGMALETSRGRVSPGKIYTTPRLSCRPLRVRLMTWPSLKRKRERESKTHTHARTSRVGGKANRSRLIGVPKSANSRCGLLLVEDLN